MAQAIPGIERQIAEYVQERDEARRYAIADAIYGSLGEVISTVSKEIGRAF